MRMRRALWLSYVHTVHTAGAPGAPPPTAGEMTGTLGHLSGSNEHIQTRTGQLGRKGQQRGGELWPDSGQTLFFLRIPHGYNAIQ